MKKFFLLFLIFTCPLFGQKYFHHHYTVDEGLPSNQIYDISESPDGVITLGTDNGISFFNGVKFHNLNTKNGLSKPYIIAAKYNQKGELLIGNYKGLFQTYKNGKIYNTKIPCETVDDIFQVNDVTIIKTYSGNYVKELNTNALTISYKTYRNDQFEKEVVIESTDLITYYKGIVQKDRLTNKIPVFSIGNESFLVDTKIHHSTHPITIPTAIPMVLMIKKRQNDWVLFSENHVYFVGFDSQIKKIIPLPFRLVDGQNRFFAEIDKTDRVWLNLQKKGLFVLENNQWLSIESYTDLKTNQNINKLFKDSKGRMWIATHENGLFCIPNTDVVHYFTNNYENFFNSFFVYNQKLYTGNRYELLQINNTGLEKIPLPETGEFKLGYFENQPALMGFQINYQHKKIYKNVVTIQCRDYCKIGENEYLFNAKHELYYEKNKIENFVFPEKTGQSYYNIINHKNQLIINDGNEVFIAKLKDTIVSQNKILYEYKKLKRIKTIYKSKGFLSNMVFKNDTLLLAENNTLIYFKDKVLKKITHVNGYAFDNINKIILHQNQIWLATVKGLISVDKPFVINKYNYLTSNDVQDICFFEDNLYVATTNGLNKIPLHLLEQKIEVPKMELSKYKSNRWNYIKNHEVSLESNQNYISIPIKIVNYLSPRNQIIEYRINQSNWSPIVNNSIDLLQISFGKTNIECRIRDVNSDWNYQKITVYKAYPFYLQTWFILSSIGLVLLVLFLFYQYKTKKLTAEKEKEIAQTTKVMELRQSALSAQMNPHFVFNSLNAIQYFVNSNQKEKSSEYLAKLSRLVRLFLLHASEPYISLQEEMKRLQLYVNLEQLRFDNFECQFNVANNVAVETLLIPNMIVQPFIENAILHGVSHLATKDGKIDVCITKNNNLLTISIEDNGYGLKTNLDKTSHISKGLNIIEERIQIMQENNPGKIFSINYQVPFPEMERKGHRVVIELTIS